MKKIAKYALKWFVVLLDRLVTLLSRRRSKRKLLLVRLDSIGDFILWLDSAKEYRRLYPEQKITLIANSAWAELAESLPYWDEVCPVELRQLTGNPLYRWKLLSKIRQAGFEVAIQPTFSRVFMHGDSIIRASGAKHRIGSQGDLSNISVRDKTIADRWYTCLLPATPEPLMELERNAELISHLSGHPFNASLPVLPVLTTLSADLKPANNYFILFPGASWHGRQWPLAQFARVLEQLQQRYSWQPVICGTPAELALCTTVAKETTASCLNLAGKTSLLELTELIRNARLLIGNETSAVHFAAAVSTPAVCILGGGHYGRFMPYPDHMEGVKPVSATQRMSCFNCNWHCNQAHDPSGSVPCVSQITIEFVLRCAMQLIE